MAEPEQLPLTGDEFGRTPEQLPQPDPILDLRASKTPEEDFAKLAPGGSFINPKGEKRSKAYRLQKDEDIYDVPDGAYFTPPGSQEVRQKPVAEGIGAEAQTIYSMAATEDAQKQVLKKYYPNAEIRTTPKGHELLIGDNKVLRPGVGWGGAVGEGIAELAPVTGMVLGALLGGGAGTLAEPGGGSLAGGVMGAMGGAALGRQVNNQMLALAGIHQSIPEQLTADVKEAAWAGVGEIGGRAVGGVYQAGKTAFRAGTGLKGFGGNVGQNLAAGLESIGINPERARYLTGATPESATMARDITQKSGKPSGLVPPSVSMPETPMLAKMEAFHSTFMGRNTFAEAAEEYANQEGRKLAEDKAIGIELKPASETKYPLTRATEKVSTEKVGKLALERAQQQMRAADHVEEELHRQNIEEYLEAKVMPHGGREVIKANYERAVNILKTAHQAVKDAATNFVQEAMKDVKRDVDLALKALKLDENPGAAWRMAAEKMKGYTAATKQRARRMYNASRKAGGNRAIDSSSLYAYAEDFLRKLPQVVRDKYPTELEDVAALATAGAKGKPVHLNFAQLHLLRSWLRHGIDWSDLTPDMREGALRNLESKVNELLHSNKAPALAKELLDSADAWYKENIPFLNHSMVKTVIHGLEENAPPNINALAKLFFDPERTEAVRRVREIVGERTWKLVQDAHVQDLMNQSKALQEGMIDANKFASHVLELERNGLLESAYDAKTAKRLLESARNVGRLKGEIPLKAETGDTLTSLMRRAEALAAEVEKLEGANPLDIIDKELKQFDINFEKAMSALRQKRKADPLGFLFNDTMSAKAVDAANKILRSQDLIMAAKRRFGPTSSVFNALRVGFVHRWLQRPWAKLGQMRAELGGEKGMTEEVQALMFPGTTLKQMHTLVNELDYLFSRGTTGDVAASLAAGSRVMNAAGHIPLPPLGTVGKFIMATPVANTVSRFVLGKAYSLVMEAVSHGDFLAWLASEVEAGGARKEAARAVLRKRMGMGLGMAGAAYEQIENANKPDPDYTPPPRPRRQRHTENTPPLSNARQARNGRWYAPDPSRPGKYNEVTEVG
jgi:hypothetical protein